MSPAEKATPAALERDGRLSDLVETGSSYIVPPTDLSVCVASTPSPTPSAADRVARESDAWTTSIIRTAIRAVAESGEAFTADDLPREALDVRPSQLGAAFRRAAGEGLIRATGRARPSRRREARARLLREWVREVPDR